MRTAIYARVSTTDQNCDLQLRELREYVTRRGWAVAGEYVDTGFSGAKARRPELDRLMRDCRTRRVDCVLVWKLDRWGRSVVHCIDSIGELAGLGVRWISVTQNIDTDQSNPMNRLLMTIMAAFAEFERECIRERVKSGMNAAKHRGQKLGRSKVIFDRQRAHDLKASGHSYRAIAKLLSISLGTVAGAFKNGSDSTSPNSIN